MRDAGNSRQDGYEDRKQIASPSSPAAGFTRTFIKADGTSWAKQSDSSEAQMGAGGDTWVTAPVTGTSSGTAGQRAYDSEFIYIATGTNTWKRGALAGFAANEYTYVSNGDSNGVLTGIGTIFGAQAWTNPSTAGYVTITALSAFGAGSAAGIVDHTANDNYQQPASNNWFKFDFGAARSLKVSKYSYRARAGSNTNTPTGFKLQGSNDNAAWTDLDTQTGLSFVADQWGTYTPATQTVHYRYIRLLQHVNDNSGQTYFTIGEFELYGHIVHE